MNIFKTDINGGLPFTLNDLRWMDAAYREAFLGFWRAFATDPDESFILTGCTMPATTPGNTVQAGWIYLYGEICKVDEHVIPNTAGTSYWEINISYDADGNKTFADSSTHDTYQVRKASVVRGAFTPHTKLGAGIKDTLHDKIILKSPRQTRVADIGAFDMTSTTVKLIPHGLSLTGKRVLDIQCFVYEDDDLVNRLVPLRFDNYINKASIVSIDATNVKIQFDASSQFNSADYDEGTLNRGYIVVVYEPFTPNY